MFSKLLDLSTFAALAAAATLSVDVSSSSGALTFSPNSMTANMGDTVVFTFQKGGHTVTQGQQSSACQPESNGFYSGTQSPPTTFTIEVNSTDPMWFYCSTPGHCQAGMVGVINPPSDMTIQQYASSASSASSNPAPSVPDGFGGTLSKSGSGSSSSGTSASSGSSTSTSSGASSAPATTTSSSSGGYGGYGGSSGGASTTNSSSPAVSTSSGGSRGYDIPASFAIMLAGAFAAYM